VPFSFTCKQCGKEFTKRSKAVIANYCSLACRGLAQRTRPVVICAHCGKEFRISTNPGQRHCSRECWLAEPTPPLVSRRKMLTCKTCGAKFWHPRGSSYLNCPECRKSKGPPVNPMVPMECARCGKSFKAVSLNGKPIEKYCGEACRRPAVMTTCEHCGKKFRRVPSAADRRFCSFRCYRCFQGETGLERRVREALESLGLEFEQEFQPTRGRLAIDFALCAHHIAIEADGRYWHQDSAKDARKDARLAELGWQVIRIDEADTFDHDNLRALIAKRIQEVAGLDAGRWAPVAVD
jgi:very-short-patch-repair endonuclease